MAKDYKSFSSVAKSRFRGMAKALGYEQVTGIVYIKPKNGWYEGFSLQASSYGNDFFYINYGVMVPDLWTPFDKPKELKNCGYTLGRRLQNDHRSGFPNGTKLQVEESAELALSLYKEQAIPWFSSINGLSDITERFFQSTNLDREQLGKHDYFMSLSAANYGLHLFKSNQLEEALVWLKEAERLYSLPLFCTRDGRFVHEREKYSRIHKPEAYEVAQLQTIRKVIAFLE